MSSVKTLSAILFVVTRALCFFYAALALQAGIALATGWSLRLDEAQTRFYVLLPFTDISYLTGIYHLFYVIFGFLLPMALYSLFFGLLGNVFRAFLSSRLFTEKHVRDLRWFYRGNFVLPATVTVIFSLYDGVEGEILYLIGLHAVIGLLAFYMAAIYQQGLSLQQEQDLII